MYRKKGRGWTKHIDFMLLDVLCMQIAFIVSYIWRFGPGNPYTDKDYRILAAAFLLIDFFVEIVSDAFKNVLKRGYLDELMAGSFNQIEKIGDYTVITASMNYASTTQLLAKRGMDILGGLVGCIITLIVTIFVGPAIYIASPGPIFFAQERIGRNGRKFRMYKFRSMYMDAEERKKELAAQNKVSDGMMFKMDFDPRIIGNRILPDGTKKTGIGQFIRKTSIDELPQFWNILKGDSGIIGTTKKNLDFTRVSLA